MERERERVRRLRIHDHSSSSKSATPPSPKGRNPSHLHRKEQSTIHWVRGFILHTTLRAVWLQPSSRSSLSVCLTPLCPLCDTRCSSGFRGYARNRASGPRIAVHPRKKRKRVETPLVNIYTEIERGVCVWVCGKTTQEREGRSAPGAEETGSERASSNVSRATRTQRSLPLPSFLPPPFRTSFITSSSAPASFSCSSSPSPSLPPASPRTP